MKELLDGNFEGGDGQEAAEVEESEARPSMPQVLDLQARLDQEKADRRKRLTTSYTSTEEDIEKIRAAESEIQALTGKRSTAIGGAQALRYRKQDLERLVKGLRTAHEPPASEFAKDVIDFLKSADTLLDLEMFKHYVMLKERKSIDQMAGYLGNDLAALKGKVMEPLSPALNSRDVGDEDCRLNLEKYACRKTALHCAFKNKAARLIYNQIKNLDVAIAEAENHADSVMLEVDDPLRSYRRERNALVNNGKSPMDDLTSEERVSLCESAKNNRNFNIVYNAYVKAVNAAKSELNPALQRYTFNARFYEALEKAGMKFHGMGHPVADLKKKVDFAYLLFTIDDTPKLENGSPLSLERLFRLEEPKGAVEVSGGPGLFSKALSAIKNYLSR